MKAILSVLFSLGLISCSTVIPFNYPIFKQCGQSWSSDAMGSDGKTICQVGCLMTSLSMALNGHGWEISKQLITPGLLNTWLRNNEGYVAGSNLNNPIICNLDKAACIFEGYGASTMSRETILSNLNGKKVVLIAHVFSPYDTKYPTHFVLVTGYDTEDTSIYYVHDPFYEKDTYSIDKIAGYNIWTLDFLNEIQ